MRIRLLATALVIVASPLFAAHHHFHAEGIAVGGDVATVAAVSLSPAGGEVSAVAGHYDSNGIRFDEATSLVSGHDDGKTSLTTSMVTLRNVDIMGRVHIDEMSVRITGRQSRGDEEAVIVFDRLQLRNVIVDGRAIDVRLDPAPVNAARTLRALRSRDDVSMDEQSSGVSASLADRNTRTLVVPGLGTLFFGEVLIEKGSRTVTMLRIEFESHYPIHKVSLGSSGTNGTDIYP
jgi:hypothetical protein